LGARDTLIGTIATRAAREIALMARVPLRKESIGALGLAHAYARPSTSKDSVFIMLAVGLTPRTMATVQQGFLVADAENVIQPHLAGSLGNVA